MPSLHLPSTQHEQALSALIDFWSRQPAVSTVVVVNSCARGTATPVSDLDLTILAQPETSAAARLALEAAWRTEYLRQPVFAELRALGPFCTIHLDVITGEFEPEVWDDGGGPDTFELDIGNLLVYGAPVWERDTCFAELQAQWLPFYPEPLRRQRWQMVYAACLYDLAFVHAYAERELLFQAFDRLYKALREFLQALFIAHRRYPLTYIKWIREQLVEHLGLPELYTQLPAILALSELTAPQLKAHADALRTLLEQWATFQE